MKCRNLRVLELTSHCKIKDDFLDNKLYTYQNGPLDNGYPLEDNGELLSLLQINTIRNHIQEAIKSENEAFKCLPKRDENGWIMNFGKKLSKKSKKSKKSKIYFV